MSRAALPLIDDPYQQKSGRGRPIDLVYLSRQTLGDPGLETEILALFSTMAATYLERISHAVDTADIAMGLHALKGAATGIGAGSVAAEATAAETELRQSGKLGSERLGDLGIAVEEVRHFIAGIVAE